MSKLIINPGEYLVTFFNEEDKRIKSMDKKLYSLGESRDFGDQVMRDGKAHSYRVMRCLHNSKYDTRWC